MGGYQMCAENVNSHKCQRHFEVPPGSVFSNKVQLLQMDCSLFKMRKENNLKKERRRKTRCSCCRCIAQYAHSNKSLVGITCDISAVITQIGAGDGQYIRRQAQSLFTPPRNPLLSHCTQTPRAENLRQARLKKNLPW